MLIRILSDEQTMKIKDDLNLLRNLLNQFRQNDYRGGLIDYRESCHNIDPDTIEKAKIIVEKLALLILN